MAQKKTSNRVLMVEFVAVGRYIAGHEFPFVYGLLKRLVTMPVNWVRFGLQPSVQFRQEEQGIGLDPGDAETLVEHATSFRPTHVLFSHKPAPSLWEKIRSVAREASGRIAWIGPEDIEFIRAATPEEKQPTELSGHPELLSWLSLVPGDWGLDPRSGTMAEFVQPDFGFEPVNDLARQMDPLGFVLAGAECAYRKDVRRNARYDGVDLTGCRLNGCGFCVGGGGQRPWKGSASERAAGQISAFARTFPFSDTHTRAELRVVGYQVLDEIVELARKLQPLEAMPMDLLMDARPDHVVRRRDRLAAAAQILNETPHRLNVCLVGVENFSASELERMNKGIRPWQNLAAVRTLRELERDHPEGFGFSGLGGLSTILFTPWTQLEDLALNLAVARHFSLGPLCGKLLASRLRLYAGLSMTALAQHDGLVVDRYEDPALDTARRNFYPDEIPWRFQDARVESVSRIAVRTTESPELDSDPLYREVQSRLRQFASETGGGIPDAIGWTATLADAAMAAKKPLAPEELFGEKRPATRSPSGEAKVVPAEVPLEQARLLSLQKAGVSRVNRLENLSRELAARAEIELEAHGKKIIRVDLHPEEGPDSRFDVFFGNDPEIVDEAVRLTRTVENETDPAVLIKAKERIGELFGYPSCCSRAFARVAAVTPAIYEWLILLKRCDHKGKIAPELNPFGLLSHVPCSFECQPSRKLSSVIADAVDPTSRRLRLNTAGNPILFLLDCPGQYVELVPTKEVSDTFAFEAGFASGTDPRIAAAARGGRIRIGEGPIVVSGPDNASVSFFLSAAVFWGRKAFHPEFWKLCATEVLDPVPEPPGYFKNARGETHPVPEQLDPRPETVALAEKIGALLSGHDVAGFEVLSVEPSLSRYALITLKSGSGEKGQELTVHAEPLEGAGPHFKAAGNLALGYSDQTPLDTRERKDAFAALSQMLAAL